MSFATIALVPITVATCRAKANIFRRPSILFRPLDPQTKDFGGAAGYRPRVRSAYCMRVYHHSLLRDGSNIGAPRSKRKGANAGRIRAMAAFRRPGADGVRQRRRRAGARRRSGQHGPTTRFAADGWRMSTSMFDDTEVVGRPRERRSATSSEICMSADDGSHDSRNPLSRPGRRHSGTSAHAHVSIPIAVRSVTLSADGGDADDPGRRARSIRGLRRVSTE